MTKEEFIKEFGINAFEDTTIFAEEYDLFDEKLDELLKEERTKTLDECITTLKNSIPYTNSDDIICGFSCAKQRLEQLKGTE